MEYGRSAVAQTALLLQASALNDVAVIMSTNMVSTGVTLACVCPGEDIQPNVCLFEKAERARILKPPAREHPPRSIHTLPILDPTGPGQGSLEQALAWRTDVKSSRPKNRALW